MIPTKEMTPHVPVSVSEIVEDVHRVSELGITMVHLHARDAITGSSKSSRLDSMLVAIDRSKELTSSKPMRQLFSGQ